MQIERSIESSQCAQTHKQSVFGCISFYIFLCVFYFFFISAAALTMVMIVICLTLGRNAVSVCWLKNVYIIMTFSVHSIHCVCAILLCVLLCMLLTTNLEIMYTHRWMHQTSTERLKLQTLDENGTVICICWFVFEMLNSHIDVANAVAIAVVIYILKTYLFMEQSTAQQNELQTAKTNQSASIKLRAREYYYSIAFVFSLLICT